FVERDLDGVRFVIAAATPEVNREVAAAAAPRNLFVNAVDDTASASAYLGGVIRRGDVTVAISTGGAAPALAGLLREALDAALPEELDAWLEVARAYRANWKRNGTPIALRRAHLLDALIAARTAAAREEERS
ncbi:MAG: uroporphyrinogen-III C-methyltransferase, partial [Deltaproteobacteria bacterium]|nr:uroporphyrinogen-III C-methyltransferase [Kofleriaceae bacterium]